jgi:VWFA-related protein
MTVPRPLAAVLTAVALLAQEPTIRTNTSLVLVPVTVTDAKGKYIDGLQPDDFILRDDGVTVKQFDMDTSDTVLSPLAVVIAIQSSGISQPALEKIHRVGGMIQPLVSGEKGEAAVLAYDVELRVLQDFTRDSDKINGAFEIIEGRTIKNAKLLDAVAKGVEMLRARPENYRRVLLILGESRDRGSKTKLAQAVEAAQRAGVAVYPITYSAQATAWTAKPQDNPSLPMGPDYGGAIVELSRLGTTNAADALARATGGRHLSFARLQGLEDAISRLGEELHSQYLLSFVPAASENKGRHTLLVGVKGHPNAVIRTRIGYWP